MARSGKHKTPAASRTTDTEPRLADHSPAAAGSNPRWVIGRYLAVSLAIFCILALRRPDALLNPQFWAEDSVVFFWQALTRGWSSLFVPYSGFLWIVPRLIAVVLSPLPAELAPFAYNLVALSVEAACCALFSLPAYRHLVRNDRLRATGCLLLACALPVGESLNGNLTNMHWYLALAVLAALALRPERVSKRSAGMATCLGFGVFLCGLTCPILMVAVPIALWQAARAARSRDWKTLAILVCLLAGILIEGIVGLNHGAGAGDAARETTLIPNLPMAIAFVGILRWMLGQGIALFLADHAMIPAAVAVSLALLVWLIWSLRNLPGSLLLCAELVLIGPVAAGIVNRHIVWATWTHIVWWRDERYWLLPGCVFVFWVAASIDRAFPAWRYSPIALATLFAFGIAGNFRIPPYPDLNWLSQAPRIREWQATGHGAWIPLVSGWSLRLPGLPAPPTRAALASLRMEPVEAKNMGPVIHVPEWKADPAWTVHRFPPEVGMPPGEAFCGTFGPGDKERQGEMGSAPFDIGGQGCIVLPLVRGIHYADSGEFVFLINAGTGETLGSVPLDDMGREWRCWAIHFRTGVDKLRILAEEGRSWPSEWLGVGEPHWCKP
jgi:hypothetical protein